MSASEGASQDFVDDIIDVLQEMGMSDKKCNVKDFISLAKEDQEIVIITLQHMGCEEMDVEMFESDDIDVDMEPSKMTLVKCREFVKDIANFIAQETKICYKSND